MLYQEITAAGTYVLKVAPGYLQGISINLPAGTGPSLRIFDNTSAALPTGGTPGIAGSAAAFAPPAAGGFLDYDLHFSNGLTIVVAGTGTMSYTVAFY
jgi:hypothetical protein